VFLGHGALLPEIRLTLVDEEHGVCLAVVAGKVQLVELGRTVKVAVHLGTATAALRRCGGFILQALHVSLHSISVERDYNCFMIFARVGWSAMAGDDKGAGGEGGERRLWGAAAVDVSVGWDWEDEDRLIPDTRL
jgi:hypothetical protein